MDEPYFLTAVTYVDDSAISTASFVEVLEWNLTTAPFKQPPRWVCGGACTCPRAHHNVRTASIGDDAIITNAIPVAKRKNSNCEQIGRRLPLQCRFNPLGTCV